MRAPAFSVVGNVPRLPPGDHIRGILATAQPDTATAGTRTVTARAQRCLQVHQ